MKFFAALAIVMGVFLLVSFIMLLISEKNNRKSLKLELISYLCTSILTITFGVLLLFKFTSWWRIFCIGMLVLILSVFLLITILLDKKGKKYIKYKTTGRGKARHITPDYEKFENKDENIEENNENN